MILIDGKKIAQEIRAELKADIEKLKSEGRDVPGLVVIIVGDNPASESYVRGKAKACEEIGMSATTEKRNADFTEKELLERDWKYICEISNTFPFNLKLFFNKCPKQRKYF